MNLIDLQRKAIAIRKQALTMMYTGHGAHIGGTLSSIEYLISLYYEKMHYDPKDPEWPDRDRFILSKGHCVEGYLAILADRGFFDKEELSTFCRFGTRLIGHPDRAVPGVEMNTGSLGHGIGGACGMALAGKRDNASYRVYVLLGDGELAEGSVWEGLMFADNYHLDNLYAAIDRNHLQISGPTEDVMRLEPLRHKCESFGFATEVVDGNCYTEILDALDRLETVTGKPKMLILDTIKGKGISFMENKVNWHHGKLSEEQYQQGMAELEQAEKELMR